MGIDPSGYGTIDDYVYQQTMKGKSTTPKTTTSTSNFYMEYYTKKAEAARNTTTSSSASDIKSPSAQNPYNIEYGKAGYVDGRYCSNVYEDEKVKRLLDADVSIYAFRSSLIKLMGEKEVVARNEIIDKAFEYLDFTWTPTEDLTGWKERDDNFYEAGVEVNGLPYSQDQRITVEEFEDALDNEDFYKRNEDRGIIMPEYGQDCSGLFSDVWGNVNPDTGEIVNLSTYNIIKKAGWNVEDREVYFDISQVGDYKIANYFDRDATEETDKLLEQYYNQAAPGDAVVTRYYDEEDKRMKNHVMIVVGNDSGNLIVIEQTEPTTELNTYKYGDLSKNQYMPIKKENIGGN